jgi:hypothetical protein
MKLGTYVCVALGELNNCEVFVGKTNIQKLIYFAMRETERNRFYHPYYYGPYSEDVQLTLSSLLKKEGASDLPGLWKAVQKGMRRVADDDIVNRLRLAAAFLQQNNITQTGPVSFLAKVHLLSRTKREDARQHPAEYIKKQARFLGWKELAKAPLEKIQRNIVLANRLEEALAA